MRSPCSRPRAPIPEVGEVLVRARLNRLRYDAVKLEAELIEGGAGGRGSEAADDLEVRRIEEVVVAIEGGHFR